jgi:hypothetical protein
MSNPKFVLYFGNLTPMSVVVKALLWYGVLSPPTLCYSVRYDRLVDTEGSHSGLVRNVCSQSVQQFKDTQNWWLQIAILYSAEASHSGRVH